MVIGRKYTMEKMVRCELVDGSRGASVEKVSGRVHGFNPISFGHGCLEKEGA
jgi:hypothetical protein